MDSRISSIVRRIEDLSNMAGTALEFSNENRDRMRLLEMRLESCDTMRTSEEACSPQSFSDGAAFGDTSRLRNVEDHLRSLQESVRLLEVIATRRDSPTRRGQNSSDAPVPGKGAPAEDIEQRLENLEVLQLESEILNAKASARIEAQVESALRRLAEVEEGMPREDVAAKAKELDAKAQESLEAAQVQVDELETKVDEVLEAQAEAMESMLRRLAEVEGGLQHEGATSKAQEETLESMSRRLTQVEVTLQRRDSRSSWREDQESAVDSMLRRLDAVEGSCARKQDLQQVESELQNAKVSTESALRRLAKVEGTLRSETFDASIWKQEQTEAITSLLQWKQGQAEAMGSMLQRLDAMESTRSQKQEFEGPQGGCRGETGRVSLEERVEAALQRLTRVEGRLIGEDDVARWRDEQAEAMDSILQRVDNMESDIVESACSRQEELQLLQSDVVAVKAHTESALRRVSQAEGVMAEIGGRLGVVESTCSRREDLELFDAKVFASVETQIDSALQRLAPAEGGARGEDVLAKWREEQAEATESMLHRLDTLESSCARNECLNAKASRSVEAHMESVLTRLAEVNDSLQRREELGARVKEVEAGVDALQRRGEDLCARAEAQAAAMDTVLQRLTDMEGCLQDSVLQRLTDVERCLQREDLCATTKPNTADSTPRLLAATCQFFSLCREDCGSHTSAPLSEVVVEPTSPRQVAATSAATENDTEALTEAFHAIQRRLENLEGSQTKSEGVDAKVTARLRAQEESTESVLRRLTQVEDDLQREGGTSKAHEQAMESMSRRLTHLEGTLQREDLYSKWKEEHESAMDSILQRIDTVEGNCPRKQDLEQLQSELPELTANVEGQLESVSRRLTHMEGALLREDAYAKWKEEQASAMDSVLRRIHTVESTCSRKQDLEQLQSELPRVSATVEALDLKWKEEHEVLELKWKEEHEVLDSIRQRFDKVESFCARSQSLIVNASTNARLDSKMEAVSKRLAYLEGSPTREAPDEKWKEEQGKAMDLMLQRLDTMESSCSQKQDLDSQSEVFSAKVYAQIESAFQRLTQLEGSLRSDASPGTRKEERAEAMESIQSILLRLGSVENAWQDFEARVRAQLEQGLRERIASLVVRGGDGVALKSTKLEQSTLLLDAPSHMCGRGAGSGEPPDSQALEEASSNALVKLLQPEEASPTGSRGLDADDFHALTRPLSSCELVVDSALTRLEISVGMSPDRCNAGGCVLADDMWSPGSRRSPGALAKRDGPTSPCSLTA